MWKSDSSHSRRWAVTSNPGVAACTTLLHPTGQNTVRVGKCWHYLQASLRHDLPTDLFLVSFVDHHEAPEGDVALDDGGQFAHRPRAVPVGRTELHLPLHNGGRGPQSRSPVLESIRWSISLLRQIQDIPDQRLSHSVHVFFLIQAQRGNHICNSCRSRHCFWFPAVFVFVSSPPFFLLSSSLAFSPFSFSVSSCVCIINPVIAVLSFIGHRGQNRQQQQEEYQGQIEQAFLRDPHGSAPFEVPSGIKPNNPFHTSHRNCE